MTVDILFPYYGDVELMKIAVRSVISQDDPDWELTVVDDGYPEEGIPAWFADLDDRRIRYERNEENLGANGNYRKCLSYIQHDIVTVMGADDIMLPNYVRTVKRVFAEHPETTFMQPGVDVIDERGERHSGLVDRVKSWYRPAGTGSRTLSGEKLAVSLMRGNWTYFPSLAWRADSIKSVGFREGLNVVQDLALAIEITKEGGRLLLTDELAFQYRRHRASDSSWRALEGTRFVEERKYFLGVADEFERIGWRRAARTARRHLSSRINAAILIPKAARRRQALGLRTLTRHAFGLR